MSRDRRLSATAISKQIDCSVKEANKALAKHSLIEHKEEGWVLTEKGKGKGGEYANHPKGGEYICWPESILTLLARGDEKEALEQASTMLSAKVIGEQLELPAQRVNRIFSEIGWIERYLKGWKLTAQGEKVGGLQREHYKTGIPFVLWPSKIVENNSFKTVVRELSEGSSGEQEQSGDSQKSGGDTEGFRDKFVAHLRATDGHYVRSRAEMLIDNWLYMAEIVHAYERKLPVEEELYCDFYIPSGKVYVEYWGYENDPKYLARKKKKLEIYSKYGFKLIELEDKDIQNLDDVLPRLLLKHGVESF